CRLDSASGCKHLAYFYYHGIGTKKDKKLAEKELKKACKLGLKEACEIVRDFH
ncbi:MAG: sel1 repeat family protein, partial [Campylobacter concisus]|nr:sel1 repeat family protein [Campylobacter concisus]